MIMSAADLRQYVAADETDQVLESKLRALELLIRAYTHNNFQARALRTKASSAGGNTLNVDVNTFMAGDTLQITGSCYNAGLVTVMDSSGLTLTVAEAVYNEDSMMVTKVVYPDDIKMGVINMLDWDLKHRDKVGVASETISRHSVTYFNMDNGNSSVGYPASLLGFLKPYMRARFGGGI